MAISLHDVHKSFGPFKAVDGVSLAVGQRSTYGLVGESGCGKTTIGRLLLRLERPDFERLAMHGDGTPELERLALPFGDATPSEAELRVAQAQLVGWLEGLFHGIQATLMSQQMAARAQLEEMRQRGLPSAGESGRPGAYL